MNIVIRAPDVELRVDVEPFWTIAKLREAVACSLREMDDGRFTNASADQIRLICKGRVLNMEHTVEGCGLADGQIVHMVIKQTDPSMSSPSASSVPTMKREPSATSEQQIPYDDQPSQSSDAPFAAMPSLFAQLSSVVLPATARLAFPMAERLMRMDINSAFGAAIPFQEADMDATTHRQQCSNEGDKSQSGQAEHGASTPVTAVTHIYNGPVTHYHSSSNQPTTNPIGVCLDLKASELDIAPEAVDRFNNRMKELLTHLHDQQQDNLGSNSAPSSSSHTTISQICIRATLGELDDLPERLVQLASRLGLTSPSTIKVSVT